MILSSLIYSLANELRSEDQGLMLNCSNHSWTGWPPNNAPFISELFEEQNLSTVNQMIGQTFSLSDSIYRVSFNTFKFRQKFWLYLPSVALPSWFSRSALGRSGCLPTQNCAGYTFSLVSVLPPCALNPLINLRTSKGAQWGEILRETHLLAYS